MLRGPLLDLLARFARSSVGLLRKPRVNRSAGTAEPGPRSADLVGPTTGLLNQSAKPCGAHMHSDGSGNWLAEATPHEANPKAVYSTAIESQF